MPDKSHKKATAKEAISKEQSKLGKYSPEEMRKHMSTGGGEPIDKNKKWTTEKRVLQPRDPDTGHFTYNADANLGLKYPQRGKGAVPVGAKNWILNDGIKKGDKVVIDDSVWIAIEDLDENKLKDYFKRYDEEAGEYVSTKDDKADKFSTNFIKKRGRVSKEEKSEMAAGEKVVGDVDLSSLGKYSQNDMSAKFAEKAKAYTPSMKSSAGIAKISASKFAANKAFNAKPAPSQQPASNKQPAPNFAGVGTGSASAASQTQPKQTSPTQSQPSSQPNKASASNQNKVVFSTKSAKGLSSAANKLGGILGGLNKNNKKKSQDSSLLDDLDLEDLGI